MSVENAKSWGIGTLRKSESGVRTLKLNKGVTLLVEGRKVEGTIFLNAADDELSYKSKLLQEGKASESQVSTIQSMINDGVVFFAKGTFEKQITE